MRLRSSAQPPKGGTKMATSSKKIIANRSNGQKSHGPADTTRTRFNATKHGLLSAGVTELDDAEGYKTQLRRMMEEKKPVGVIEKFLVESATLDMVKWRRARRMEAEYITEVLNPPTLGPEPLGDLGNLLQAKVLDPGLPASVDAESAQRLVNTFPRYESAIASRFFRTLHELERLQRIRGGEVVPTPAALDVTIHSEMNVSPTPECTTIESAANDDRG